MATIESLLPESGVGFLTMHRNSNTHFATKRVFDLLIKITGLWHEQHPDLPVTIGHISRRGGGNFNPPHFQHQDGVEADVRLLRNDGSTAQVTINNPAYSRALTREFVRLVHANATMHKLYLNDTVLINEGLTNRANSGHRDHMHLWFATPRDMRRGNVGEDVKRLQEALIAAGFPMEGGADGEFGRHTQDAVKAFQTANPPLTATGIADEDTQIVLGL